MLTEEGVAFLRQFCAGRAGHELMFTHSDGSEMEGERAGPSDGGGERTERS